jgi:hypothetical protein
MKNRPDAYNVDLKSYCGLSSWNSTTNSDLTENALIFAVNAVPVPTVYDFDESPARPPAAYAPNAVLPVIALKFATTAAASN